LLGKSEKEGIWEGPEGKGDRFAADFWRVREKKKA